MPREILPGVWTWSVFSEEKGYAFNGYAVATARGTVLVDPPEPGDEGWETFDSLAPFQGVWATNRNHSRAAGTFRDRYRVAVFAHQEDAERLEVGADETLGDGATIGDEIRVLNVPGKSPGELAFYLPRSQAMIVGDLVIGVPPGELSTYPDEVIDDRDALHRSAARLLEFDFDALLVCDGTSLPVGGREKLRRFLESESVAV